MVQNVAATREALNEALEGLANDLEIASTTPNANMSALLKVGLSITVVISWQFFQVVLFQKAYLTLIKIDGKYTGSTFYKLEERDVS